MKLTLQFVALKAQMKFCDNFLKFTLQMESYCGTIIKPGWPVLKEYAIPPSIS